MPERRNPMQMNASAIVDEIHQIREEIQDRAVRLAVLSQTLHAQARRRDVRREYETMGEELSTLEFTLRTASQEQATQIQEQIGILRRNRQAQQERISVYTVFANHWTRFAGMITQGLQRSRSTDRLVERLPKTSGEDTAEERPEVVRSRPEEPQQETDRRGSPFEDLIDLYGEEILNADRR